MAIIETNTENFRKFYEYLEIYKCLYSEKNFKFIRDNFFGNIKCDILMQIYAKLDLLLKSENIYLEFFNKIKEYHGVDKNIYEIGCGFYPILTEYIDQEQTKIGYGSVIGFDPEVIIKQVNNAHLIKKYFDFNNINVELPDLLVAFAPCEATIPIIEYANYHHISFSYAFCGCIHSNANYFGSVNEWHNFVYRLAKGTLDANAILEMDYFDDSFEYPYPILSKKYKNTR